MATVRKICQTISDVFGFDATSIEWIAENYVAPLRAEVNAELTAILLLAVMNDDPVSPILTIKRSVGYGLTRAGVFHGLEFKDLPADDPQYSLFHDAAPHLTAGVTFALEIAGSRQNTGVRTGAICINGDIATVEVTPFPGHRLVLEYSGGLSVSPHIQRKINIPRSSVEAIADALSAPVPPSGGSHWMLASREAA